MMKRHLLVSLIALFSAGSLFVFVESFVEI